MLFEATGDSELDSWVTCDVAHMGKLTACSTADDVEDILMHPMPSLAEDDALSCSCDNLCSDDFDATSLCDYGKGNDEAEWHNQDEQARLVFMDDHDRHDPAYPDDEDEDQDAVDQVLAGRVNNVINKRINSYQQVEPPGGGPVPVGVIMNMIELVEAGRPKESKVYRKPELINRRERERDRDKDRLFWESCLSS